MTHLWLSALMMLAAIAFNRRRPATAPVTASPASLWSTRSA
jgi:hypothetical protein